MQGVLINVAINCSYDGDPLPSLEDSHFFQIANQWW